MEDKLDLIILKLKTLEAKVTDIQKTVESHRIEHGFQKMQEGGINANFDNPENNGSAWPQPGSPPGMGGLGQGYQVPGMGAPPQNNPRGYPTPHGHPPGFGPGDNDPSRPPGM